MYYRLLDYPCTATPATPKSWDFPQVLPPLRNSTRIYMYISRNTLALYVLSGTSLFLSRSVLLDILFQFTGISPIGFRDPLGVF